MLRIRNLRAGYDGLEVLHGVSLHVNAGEIVTIIGANGAGKSTLLNAIAGIVRSSSGTAVFASADITSLPAEAVASRGCVLVPEGRQIFADLSVRENLLLGAYLRARRDGRRRVDSDIEEIYGLFPVLGGRHAQTAGTLSGGEQQMLALGRALMAKPGLLMLDEPSIGLAPLVVREIFSVIAGLRRQGKTVLLVEQNARAALAIADRGYVMETGRIMVEGTAEELAGNHDVRRAYLGREYRRIDE
jgi:branched-chain amino acid transport system ATP-binding protein